VRTQSDFRFTSNFYFAEHLFERAIVGELLSQRGESSKPRSVVLVTNALQFLRSPKVSRIVVLQEGRVVEQGSYSELTRQKNSVFTRILAVITESGVGSGTGSSQAQGLEKLMLPVVERNEATATNGDQLTPKSPPKTGIVKTMTEEARMTGHVGLDVYMSWARAAGGAYVPIVVLVVYASNEALRVFANWFLTYWSSHGSVDNQSHFLGIYAGIGVCVALGGAFSNLIMLSFGLTASRRVRNTTRLISDASSLLTFPIAVTIQLFTNLLDAVLHAPMSFFDTTPVGRLINRFSKGKKIMLVQLHSLPRPVVHARRIDSNGFMLASDMFTVDEQLNYSFAMYLVTLYSVFSTIVVISGVTPVFALCLVPMCLFYVGQQKYFTVRDLGMLVRPGLRCIIASQRHPLSTDHLSRAKAP
jgi:ATP-binding cassette, subfamily C (CFTR/MRP), member 1